MRAPMMVLDQRLGCGVTAAEGGLLIEANDLIKGSSITLVSPRIPAASAAQQLAMLRRNE